MILFGQTGGTAAKDARSAAGFGQTILGIYVRRWY